MTKHLPSAYSAKDPIPPRNAMPPFAALRAFDAVARLGSIRRAAQALEIDHGVVSRHLRALEIWTRTSLVERAQGGSALTEAGLLYHRGITRAIDGIATATLDLLHLQNQSRLRIWCVPGFAFQWLAPRLGTFEEANAQLDIELHPTDTMPDFGKHEAEVDVRYMAAYGKQIDLPTNVQSIELASPPVIAVASPEYLASHPSIDTAHDMLQHTMLHEENFENWRAWFLGQGVDPREDITGPRLWHAHATIDIARRGRGIALVNHFLAGDDLRSGRLVEIGAGRFEPVSQGTYVLVARQDRWTNAPISRFRRWLLDSVRDDPGVQQP